jgi:uncharacterized phiE125 gp8 family phage protein
MINQAPTDPRQNWKVTTAPAVEPFKIDDLKLFGRISGVEDDELLKAFIVSARDATERYLGRALIQQTITMLMDVWPGIRVALPMPPLISITSVSTIDEDDTKTTYSSDNYYAVTGTLPGQLVLKNGVTPPINTDRFTAGYEIIYKAGYGTASTDVPSAIIDGIKLWAMELYEGRTLSAEPPEVVRGLLMPYKVNWI